LSRHETALQNLRKSGTRKVRQGRDGIARNLGRGDHVEIDETWIVRGEGGGPKVDDSVLVSAAVEVGIRPTKKDDKPMRRGGRFAGRSRLGIVPNRSARTLVGFVEKVVEPGAMVGTDAAPAYNNLSESEYVHLLVVEAGNGGFAEEYELTIPLVFSNIEAWLPGTHHRRVEPRHLQAYLNELTFRFSWWFYPYNAFRS
jgi:ISXO2-like transposase domain